MTEHEFEIALDRWGSDLGQWPPEQAALARKCLAARPGARRALEEAVLADRYLAGLCTHHPPVYLKARILARLPAVDSGERLLAWLTARLWRPAVLALLPVAAGFLVGLALTEPLDTDLTEEVVTLAFTDLYGEVEYAQP